MSAILYIMYFVHILVSLFLILVVLLQQGKGADLSVFGGGSTQAAFGARGAATLLHKLTVGGFVLFTLTTLTIQIMKGRLTGSSVTTGIEPPVTQSAPLTPGTTPDSTPPNGSAPPAAGTTAPAPTSGEGTEPPPAGTVAPPGAAAGNAATQAPAEAPAGTPAGT